MSRSSLVPAALTVSLLVAGPTSAPASGQSVEDVREIQLIALGTWMDSNPGVAVCLAGLAKPSSWTTPVAPDADIPAPTPSELSELRSQLAARFPTRVVSHCIPVRDGIPTNALDELLQRTERRGECESLRSSVVEAETRGAPQAEIVGLLRAGSFASCFPSNRSLMGPYGERAATLAISMPLFRTEGSALLVVAPSFRTSANSYLFCSFEQRGARWVSPQDCEQVTYTH